MSALAKHLKFCEDDFTRMHLAERYTGKIVNIKYLNHGAAKVGFQVRKKVIKLAVDRNYIKRLLKESFRNSVFKGFKGSVLISIKKKVSRSEMAETLASDWNDFMRKLKYV